MHPQLKRKQVQARFAEHVNPAVAESAADFPPGAEVLQSVERAEFERGGGPHDRLPDPVGGADGEQSARFEDAGHLPQRLPRVGRVLDALGRNDGVETVAAENVDQHQAVGLDAAAAGPLDGAADEVLAQVAGGDVGAARGETFAELAQSAPHVEDGPARDVVGGEVLVDQDFETPLSVVLGDGGLEPVSQSFMAEFPLADGAHAGS